MDIANYKYMDSLFLQNYKKMDERTLYRKSELKVVKEDEAVILPMKKDGGSKLAGVVTQSGDYVELSGLKAISDVDSWGGSYDFDAPDYMDYEVVYFGRFWRHWGHFLMDMISRVWYVLDEDKSSDKKVKIVYDATEDISGVYLDFIKLLGISADRLIRIEKPTRFKRVIVPECSHCPGIYFSKEYRDIFDKVISEALKKIPSPEKYKGRKIYFTRKMQKNLIPMEVGEKEIEEVFVKNGFMVIAPEQHSLAEQIAMVNLADTIACVSGTLPHNMVFAHEGENLVIIRKTNKPNYRQVDVNEMRNLSVTNVDAHISPKAVGPSGPFVLDFNKNMKAFCDDNGFSYRKHTLVRWIRRKLKLLWYVPVYYKRNRGKNFRTPVFDGERFVNEDDAEKKQYRYYIKRI